MRSSKAELKRGRYTKYASVPVTSAAERGRSPDGSHSSSWEAWSVVRGGALERICRELVESRHSHISHFALCLRAAESFRREITVGRGPHQVRGAAQRRQGGEGSPGCFYQICSMDPDSQDSSLWFFRCEDPGQWTQARPIYQPARRIHSQFSCFQKKAITSDCFLVSQVCGFFRFTQRLITKPIPPICGVVVSAGKPINWMHTSAWGEPDHRLKSERWSHCSSWSPWNQHSFGCRHSPKTGVGAIVNSVVTVTLENNLNADDSPRGNLNLTIWF